MPDSSDNVNARNGASIVWGPEIRVNGKRPEWLRSRDAMQWRSKNDLNFFGKGLPAERYLDGDTLDGCIDFIRLPADHPHYTKAPTTPELDPALWNRMEALVRRMAERELDAPNGVLNITSFLGEADSIVADLPKPVDPDLIEARNLVECTVHWSPQTDRDLQSGKNDNTPEMKIALAAIKRGRELAGEQA